MRNPGRLIVWFVAAIGVAAFASGWWVTGEVRSTARRTDRELELVAGAIERYAAAHAGDMPLSAQALEPADDDLAQALRHIQVRWPPEPGLAPMLEANGLPTGIGTLPRLNERLRSLARGSAAAAGPS
jgi:hypothetical protein